MKEDTLKAAKEFIAAGGLLLDKLQLQIADLLGNEEENEDEIEELRVFHDNLEIAISRTEDIITPLENANG